MKFECPYCKEKYNIKRKQLGMQATCSMCEKTFILHIEGVEPISPKAKKSGGLMKLLLPIVVVLGLAGGGAYWYFKIYKPGQSSPESDKKSESSAVKAITAADTTVSRKNLKQIFIALQSGDTMPQSLKDVQGTLSDPKVFIAPFDKVSTPAEGEIKPENTSYAYIGGSEKIGTPVIIAFEKPWLFPDGWNKINVLMADGSVTEATVEDLNKKTCKQIVEELTKDYQDKKVAEGLVKKAEEEDAARAAASKEEKPAEAEQPPQK